MDTLREKIILILFGIQIRHLGKLGKLIIFSNVIEIKFSLRKRIMNILTPYLTI